GGRERRQPVRGARAVAALVACTVGPRGHELAARRRALRIDGAAHRTPDLALERDAARRRAARAAHRDAVRADFLRELRGRRSAEEALGLAPMKRDTVMRAA